MHRNTFFNTKGKFRRVYAMAEDAGQGNEGGAPQGEAPKQEQETFTREDVQKAVAEANRGLESKRNELLGELKDAKNALKKFEGLDPDNVRSMMEKLEQDEVLKLHAEGKHDEAYNKMMEKERATHQSKLDGVTKEATTWKEKAETLENQVRDLIIDQQVLSNFMQAKGLEHAAPDVVLRAKQAFKVEDGVAIVRDENGEIRRGENGPMTVKEWIAELRTTAPHLFPASRGAGAEGGYGSGAGSDIDARMAAASDAGDMKEYRRLRDMKRKAAEG